MPIFYRIQNKDGNEPYWTGGHSLDKMIEDHGSLTKELHPTPQDEQMTMLYLMHEKHIFGFESLNQLMEWFTDEELALMAEQGYMIHEIEGIAIHRSSKQVIFQASPQGKDFQMIKGAS